MAASTRAAISADSSLSRWFKNRDTVALDTPATRATSAMVLRAASVGTVSSGGWGAFMGRIMKPVSGVSSVACATGFARVRRVT